MQARTESIDAHIEQVYYRDEQRKEEQARVTARPAARPLSCSRKAATMLHTRVSPFCKSMTDSRWTVSVLVSKESRDKERRRICGWEGTFGSNFNTRQCVELWPE